MNCYICLKEVRKAEYCVSCNSITCTKHGYRINHKLYCENCMINKDRGIYEDFVNDNITNSIM
jgi:hypothetical protein